MFRSVQDTGYASGAVVGGAGQSFQAVPTLEGIDASVLDARASGSTALGLGTLWVEQFLAANSGDANYAPSAVVAAALPLLSYGILTGIPPPPAGGSLLITGKTTGGGNEIRLRQKGYCLALCVTGGTYAIAAGTLLVADGAGNLTPIGATTPAPGIVLAIAKGVLAISQAATLVAVTIGGY